MRAYNCIWVTTADTIVGNKHVIFHMWYIWSVDFVVFKTFCVSQNINLISLLNMVGKVVNDKHYRKIDKQKVEWCWLYISSSLRFINLLRIKTRFIRLLIVWVSYVCVLLTFILHVWFYIWSLEKILYPSVIFTEVLYLLLESKQHFCP